jgi:hypothetical protein
MTDDDSGNVDKYNNDNVGARSYITCRMRIVFGIPVAPNKTFSWILLCAGNTPFNDDCKRKDTVSCVPLAKGARVVYMDDSYYCAKHRTWTAFSVDLTSCRAAKCLCRPGRRPEVDFPRRTTYTIQRSDCVLLSRSFFMHLHINRSGTLFVRCNTTRTHCSYYKNIYTVKYLVLRIV